MPDYRGLTWDHPRGRRALEETAAEWAARGVSVTWDAQPLEGFEAHPIEDLAERYDLIVLDHPHVGDALATGSLQPVDHILTRTVDAFVGPSLESYRVDGRLWALPLDAAAQVGARDARLLAEAPRTWAEVEDAADAGGVALSLAGPHAVLSLFSVAGALGRAPVDEPGSPWLDDDVAAEAFDILARVQVKARPGYESLNPIGLLEKLGSDDPLAYVPLVYGYVTYATADHPVTFSDAPRIAAGDAPGSIIGGTGLAVSARAEVTPELVSYLRWLIADDTQTTVIPALSGQPAARAAWTDPQVDLAAGGFYSSTLATLDSSSVRPRAAGFPEKQQRASEIVRDGLRGALPRAEALRLLRDESLSLESVRSTP